MRLVAWTIVVTLLAPSVSAIACGISCVEVLTERPVQARSCHEVSAASSAVSSSADGTCHRDAEPSLTAVPTSVRPDALPVSSHLSAAAAPPTSTATPVVASVRPPPRPVLHAAPLQI